MTLFGRGVPPKTAIGIAVQAWKNGMKLIARDMNISADSFPLRILNHNKQKGLLDMNNENENENLQNSGDEKSEDVETPQVDESPLERSVLGELVHDKAYPAEQGAPNDGIAIAEHDDGTITVALFASTKRVPKDSVNFGPSVTFDPNK